MRGLAELASCLGLISAFVDVVRQVIIDVQDEYLIEHLLALMYLVALRPYAAHLVVEPSLDIHDGQIDVEDVNPRDRVLEHCTSEDRSAVLTAVLVLSLLH
jgi:hypothetical protein